MTLFCSLTKETALIEPPCELSKIPFHQYSQSFDWISAAVAKVGDLLSGMLGWVVFLFGRC